MYCNGKRLGVFGKLANEINAELEIAKDQKDSQNIYLGELDYEALMSCVEGELRYQPLSPYAPVKRDLALVCDETVYLRRDRRDHPEGQPAGERGQAVRYLPRRKPRRGQEEHGLQPVSCLIPKKEVSAEEVERVVKKILGNLKFKLGIEIR